MSDSDSQDERDKTDNDERKEHDELVETNDDSTEECDEREQDEGASEADDDFETQGDTSDDSRTSDSSAESSGSFDIRHTVSIGIFIVLVVVTAMALTVPEQTSSGMPSMSEMSEMPRSPQSALEALNPQLITKRRAPDFELPDRAGKVHRLSELQGRPVLLNFWSVDCPPCIQEMPSLILLDQVARQSKRFHVVTATVDESRERVGELFPEGSSLLVLFDPERSVIQEQYGTRLFPETFLIDSDGFIRARFDGQRNWTSRVVLEMIREVGDPSSEPPSPPRGDATTMPLSDAAPMPPGHPPVGRPSDE